MERSAKALETESKNIFDTAITPVTMALQDRPLMKRFTKAMLIGGAAAYMPSLIILPNRGARRNAFCFGAGAGLGWTARQVVDTAVRAGENGSS